MITESKNLLKIIVLLTIEQVAYVQQANNEKLPLSKIQKNNVNEW